MRAVKESAAAREIPAAARKQAHMSLFTFSPTGAASTSPAGRTKQSQWRDRAPVPQRRPASRPTAPPERPPTERPARHFQHQSRNTAFGGAIFRIHCPAPFQRRSGSSIRSFPQKARGAPAMLLSLRNRTGIANGFKNPGAVKRRHHESDRATLRQMIVYKHARCAAGFQKYAVAFPHLHVPSPQRQNSTVQQNADRDYHGPFHFCLHKTVPFLPSPNAAPACCMFCSDAVSISPFVPVPPAYFVRRLIETCNGRYTDSNIGQGIRFVKKNLKVRQNQQQEQGRSSQEFNQRFLHSQLIRSSMSLPHILSWQKQAENSSRLSLFAIITSFSASYRFINNFINPIIAATTISAPSTNIIVFPGNIIALFSTVHL